MSASASRSMQRDPDDAGHRLPISAGISTIRSLADGSVATARRIASPRCRPRCRVRMIYAPRRTAER